MLPRCGWVRAYQGGSVGVKLEVVRPAVQEFAIEYSVDRDEELRQAVKLQLVAIVTPVLVPELGEYLTTVTQIFPR
jgi:hypothetical protein